MKAILQTSGLVIVTVTLLAIIMVGLLPTVGVSPTTLHVVVGMSFFWAGWSVPESIRRLYVSLRTG